LSRLRGAAVIAFCLHLLAGAVMALIMRNGLETNPDFQSRITFIADHRVLWTAAWLTWTGAAIAILYFYSTFTEAHHVRPIAVYLTVAAVVMDMSAQAIEIGLLPGIASGIRSAQSRTDTFLALHRMAVMLSGFAANSLYSFSALFLAWKTRSFYSAWIWRAGVAAGSAGLALSIAAAADSAAGMMWTNVVLLPCLLLWLAGIATTSNKRSL